MLPRNLKVYIPGTLVIVHRMQREYEYIAVLHNDINIRTCPLLYLNIIFNMEIVKIQQKLIFIKPSTKSNKLGFPQFRWTSDLFVPLGHLESHQSVHPSIYPPVHPVEWMYAGRRRKPPRHQTFYPCNTQYYIIIWYHRHRVRSIDELIYGYNMYIYILYTCTSCTYNMYILYYIYTLTARAHKVR